MNNTDVKCNKVKSVKNALIDFYLDGFKRREAKTERPSVVFFNHLTLVCFISSIIKLLACFMPLSRSTKLILFDAGTLFGGIELYSRIFYITGTFLGAVTNITLRLTKGHAYKEWTRMFDIARSPAMVRAFGDNEILVKVIRMMKIQCKIVNVTLVIFSIVNILMLIKMNFKHYDLKTFLLSIPFQVINYIHYTMFFFDAMAFLTFIIIIGYYEHLRINVINGLVINELQDTNGVLKAVKRFTEEHNRYCTHIWLVNHFWRYQLLAFFVSSFPINLILMHQVLFEHIPVQIRLFYVLGLILNDSQLFGVQYCFAQLSVKIHKMAAKVARLQWSLGRDQMRTKLKLVMCLDRLVSKQRIGISMGSLVFTMPLFATIVLKYCRFFILTHKFANKFHDSQ